MAFRKKQVTYVSEFDQYLQAFDKSHELTASQRAEQNKANMIASIRDKDHEDDL